MTAIDRDQLRKLADAATGGPWGFDFDLLDGQMVVFESRSADGGPVVCSGRDLDSRDAEFIAAAREAVPALLDQIDQAEHRLDHWQEAYKREANRRAAAVTERDEWRQTAQDEHAAALDLIEVVKVRDQRIEDVRDVLDAADKDERWWVQEWGHHAVMTAAIRRALDGDA